MRIDDERAPKPFPKCAVCRAGEQVYLNTIYYTSWNGNNPSCLIVYNNVYMYISSHLMGPIYDFTPKEVAPAICANYIPAAISYNQDEQ